MAENNALELMEYDASIRHVMVNGQPHFSIIDVFKHYGAGSTNPRLEWSRAKVRLEEQGFDVVSKMLQHQFEGRGQRLTPVASFETFLRIAMIAPFKNWESLREYMVQATREKIAATVPPLEVPLLPLSQIQWRNIFQTELGWYKVLIRQYRAAAPPGLWFHWYLGAKNAVLVLSDGLINHHMVIREGTADDYELARSRALDVLKFYHEYGN